MQDPSPYGNTPNQRQRDVDQVCCKKAHGGEQRRKPVIELPENARKDKPACRYAELAQRVMFQRRHVLPSILVVPQRILWLYYTIEAAKNPVNVRPPASINRGK